MAFFWDWCIVCQKISDTPLKCPLNANTNDTERREVYKNFLENVREFQSQGCLPVELKLDLSTTVEVLIANRASWHKNCRLKFSPSRHAAKRKRESEEEEAGNLRKSKRRQGSKNYELCIFCKKDSVESLHDFTSFAVDKKIRDMDKELEDIWG